MGEPAGAAPLVEVEGLERRYGERAALSGVSFALREGQTLGLFGPNGAGKSTLLRVLATLLRPHGGQVRVLGADLPGEAWKVRGRVGYVGHDPLLYRELSGRENLVFHARLHRVEESRVDELIKGVGMERRARDPVRELSRGMVQRLSAARALLHDPALLLLDEPYSGLDPAARELLDPLIGKPSGRTRVLVSHDLAAGAAECDAALGLRAGRQVHLGSPDAAELRRLLFQ
ncbi:MAG TPA: ABC transporter ATP-binding protein [Thermoleophilaceae bacterium]